MVFASAILDEAHAAFPSLPSMTAKSNLEVSGSFLLHPFAELAAELASARLHGSLRIAQNGRRAVIYFRAGCIVFAVSNVRAFRIYEMLLEEGKISPADLAQVSNFTNDLEFASALQGMGVISKEERDQVMSQQVQRIVVDALRWDEGEWTFSSLARVRDGLAFDVNAPSLLMDHGRCLPIESVLKRFRSLNEVFHRSDVSEMSFDLTPEEAFVLSRANDGPTSVDRIVQVAGMSQEAALKTLYTMWLGGLLTRQHWQPAISEEQVAAMKNARLELKQEAKVFAPPRAVTQEPVKTQAAATTPSEPESPKVSLTEYLARVENAATYYDVLGIAPRADLSEVKRAYIALARVYHPDRFRSEDESTRRRLQSAFGELTQAHETLKTQESRDLYDYRMRKELAERDRKLSSDAAHVEQQLKMATENFNRGFDLLLNDKPEDAIVFLARAATYAPRNARYRAYYGKALAADETQRHKAEAELQAAIRLEGDNPTFRIMLAEFFIEYRLFRRAEGELRRLLAIFPSHKAARELLQSIKSNIT
jgi:curved DNA-binding protein CbpA